MPLRWLPLLSCFAVGTCLGTIFGGRMLHSSFPSLSDRHRVDGLETPQTAAPPPPITPSDPRPRGERAPTAAPDLKGRAWLERWSASGAPVEEATVALTHLAQWAQQDPRAALEFVWNAPRFPGRLRALVPPLRALCSQDLNETVAWMHAHLTLEERATVGPELARHLGSDNPALALNIAFAPDVPVDRRVFGPLIGNLARTDPARALAYFARLSEQGRIEAAGPLIAQWFAADPDAALGWCAAQREELHGAGALRALITTAARTSPESLATILNRLPLSSDQMRALGINPRHFSADAAWVLLPHLDGAEREIAIDHIVQTEMQRDPASVLRIVHEHLPEAQARELISRSWRAWHRSDAKAAIAWAEALGDPALKGALLEEPVDPLLKMNPAQFLARAASVDPASRDCRHIDEAIVAVADGDPGAAAAWITRLPGTVSPGTVREVACEWLQRDETAAWAWVASLPSGTMRDTALVGAIDHWIRRGDTPQMTAALAAIEDPRQQARARWRIVQRIHMRDPKQARAWLLEQTMPGEVRESWLAILESDSDE